MPFHAGEVASDLPSLCEQMKACLHFVINIEKSLINVDKKVVGTLLGLLKTPAELKNWVGFAEMLGTISKHLTKRQSGDAHNQFVINKAALSCSLMLYKLLVLTATSDQRRKAHVCHRISTTMVELISQFQGLGAEIRSQEQDYLEIWSSKRNTILIRQ